MTMAWTRVAALVATLVLGQAGMATAQSTAWLHVTVETRGATGEQVSTFRAFTTSDQAGTQRITVDRLCVKGIAHQVGERCVENADAVELVETTRGLSGVGNLCVEAVASATSKVGPLSATARACP
jgi:hypothetical protein